MKRKKAILAIMLAGVITGMTATTIAVPMTAYAATTTESTSDSTTDTTSSTTAVASNATDSTNSVSTPPEKPDGDTSGPSDNGGTPPEMPSGEAPSGEAPDGAPGNGGESSAPGNGGGQSSAPTSYTAATEYSEDTTTTDEAYDSTGTDENAVLISGGNVVLNNPTVTRNSSDSTGGDNASFYGVGASILNTGGTAYVNGGTITSDAKGGAGIFSYGDSATTYAKGVTINTTEDTSGGVHVAGGGTLYGWGLDVTTNGESSAAIRSDRGGGTMVIDGGTYTTNGTGSPSIYSTADITVNNATLIANNSEGICIEGENTIRLFDSDLTSNMPDNEQNDTTWSVILYQSMSGDSEEGTSEFDMVGGSLTSSNGGIFYTTNTASKFYIEDVEITSTQDGGADYFLRVTGNENQRGWGNSGSNGADCTFTASNQEMDGDIIYDSISNLDLYMENGSVLAGGIIDDESSAGGTTGDGEANVYISDDSKWVVTKDSALTNLYNEGTIVDSDGNTVSIVGADGTTYVEGTSSYTITVSGTYSATADFSGASTAPSWSDYEVDCPTELTADSLGTKTTTATAASVSATDAEADSSAVAATEAYAKKSVNAVKIAVIAVICAIAAALFGVLAHVKRKK